uniref:Uncharacterized protein n=1 Tax=Klebsiella pneumoniae TaxID=573 RepID=A0A2P1BNE4_KLEPN|nr:hypothetical protein [Klebsiella pneumoniae]
MQSRTGPLSGTRPARALGGATSTTRFGGMAPFSGGLSARSAAYALTVLSALFRWLIEQRYVLANPFAGVKVRGHALRPALDTARGFTEENGYCCAPLQTAGMVLRLVRAGSTTPALHARLRLCHGPAR